MYYLKFENEIWKITKRFLRRRLKLFKKDLQNEVLYIFNTIKKHYNLHKNTERKTERLFLVHALLLVTRGPSIDLKHHKIKLIENTFLDLYGFQ